ncbi:hypothetical protein D9757_011402 [Collybiopsis confluens]|uniref:Alpha-type protein kinase domain-containing protein n=1 Tax=Collybiopsis confluens TaxID=2823264 RepID=A0A8H5LK85_9AGAR|nr:hypothetical protein D9757_011402 [Collybiopsis confluens]
MSKISAETQSIENLLFKAYQDDNGPNTVAKAEAWHRVDILRFEPGSTRPNPGPGPPNLDLRFRCKVRGSEKLAGSQTGPNRGNTASSRTPELQSCGSTRCNQELGISSGVRNPDTSNIPEAHHALAERTRNRFSIAVPPAPTKISYPAAQIQDREQVIRTGQFLYSISWAANFKGKSAKFNSEHGNSTQDWKGNEYMNENKVNAYIHHLPPGTKPSKNPKERRLYLELTVDSRAYDSRVEAIEFDNEVQPTSRSSRTSSRKRSISSTNSTKSTVGGSRITSTFKAPASNSINPTIYEPSQINFIRFNCEIDPSYQPRFIKINETVSGRLMNQPFAHGGMKAVFDLQLKGHDFAAKKYIKFSDDTVDNDLLSDTEKIRKNKYLLYSDAGRLMQCAAFLRAFYDYAQRNDVQRIDWDIQFSKCFLLQEDGATPSIASAMKFAFGEDEGVTWLVEPRRSTSFEKFTGTLCHSRAYFGGLASETVHAFAHYVYIFTKHEVVVADLQDSCLHA